MECIEKIFELKLCKEFYSKTINSLMYEQLLYGFQMFFLIQLLHSHSCDSSHIIVKIKTNFLFR